MSKVKYKLFNDLDELILDVLKKDEYSFTNINCNSDLATDIFDLLYLNTDYQIGYMDFAREEYDEEELYTMNISDELISIEKAYCRNKDNKFYNKPLFQDGIVYIYVEDVIDDFVDYLAEYNGCDEIIIFGFSEDNKIEECDRDCEHCKYNNDTKSELSLNFDSIYNFLRKIKSLYE